MSELLLEPSTKSEGPNDDRRTPAWLFAALDRTYRFSWDLAANAENALCGSMNFFGPGSMYAEDALNTSWERAVHGEAAIYATSAWLNPPFSRQAGGIMAWVKKAEAEVACFPLSVVMLISADTSTEYYRYCRKNFPCWHTKRLVFDNVPGEKRNSAKFGSVIVEIRPPTRGVYFF